MSYAGASNACERHWVWMRMSWRRQGTAPSTKTILRKRDVRPWTTGMDGTVGGGLSPETVSVFGFRPFPKRGGAATNDRIDALREDDLSGCISPQGYLLMALLDSDRVSHRIAGEGFSLHETGGWASCPLTQNGCLRIMPPPDDPHRIPVSWRLPARGSPEDTKKTAGTEMFSEIRSVRISCFPRSPFPEKRVCVSSVDSLPPAPFSGQSKNQLCFPLRSGLFRGFVDKGPKALL